MVEAAVVTALLPLLGVALGSIGTLASQYLVLRVESSRERARAAVVSRTERKDAIASFLSAAQGVEHLDACRTRGYAIDGDLADDLMSRVWLTKKLLDLVCSSEVAQAAHDYAIALDDTLWADVDHRPPPKRHSRWAFLEAARHDLGVMDSALWRQRPVRGEAE